MAENCIANRVLTVLNWETRSKIVISDIIINCHNIITKTYSLNHCKIS